MEGSCTEGSTTSDGGRAALPPAGHLCRLGSGGSATSAILDIGGDQAADSKKLPSSRYKGVVPQPNGRWGAQIYQKHQRVWLGTFNEEHVAARAYDVAAQRFRGRDAVINFTPLSDAAEISFLTSRSKSEIVDMLRKHTYSDELHQSRRHYSPSDLRSLGVGPGPVRASSSDLDHLFEKTVTPSDVGKLNRLVIPKQHAEKHFPMTVSADGKGVLLNFEDVNDKVWRFRYSYWNSSQSYVLTKGWSRFVKEKSLKAGDVVCFLRSSGPERQLYIDFRVKTTSSAPQGATVEEGVDSVPEKETESDSIRLFGVDINSGVGNRKRGRDAEDVVVLDLLLSLDGGAWKRPMVFQPQALL